MTKKIRGYDEAREGQDIINAIRTTKLKGKSGTIKGVRTPLVGARVKCIRQSQRTGGITVEFLEDRRPYKIGDQLHIYQYEFEVDSYKRIEVTNPAYPRIVAMREAGKFACDSEDHNESSGCSNPACFNHPKDTHRIDVPVRVIKREYWAHCPFCDDQRKCIAVSGARGPDNMWVRYECLTCDETFEFPRKQAKLVETPLDSVVTRPATFFVLCTNDFPYVVFPLGTTEEEAEAARVRLNAADEKWCRKPLNGGHRRIYYHIKSCAAQEPDAVQVVEERR